LIWSNFCVLNIKLIPANA